MRCLTEFLTADTAPLAAGYAVISTGVNARLDAVALRILAGGGTRMIAQRSTGFNNIDLIAAAELGLTVARVSHYSPHSVAEFAWALGSTVGVVGTGKIGECFARIAAGYGTRLLGWDLVENVACRDALGMSYTSLDRLLTESDLVSLHVPLMPDTHHLIGASALARMKPGAILINTSRGGLVDAGALVATLRTGRLRGVGLDVYEEETGLFSTDKSLEGIADDTLARLMTFPHVLVTSHQAYFTATAVREIVATTAANVEDYLAGRRSVNTLVPMAE
jgi:D-lactate dehydrogenase